MAAAGKKRERWLTGWMYRETGAGFYALALMERLAEEGVEAADFCPGLFHRATDYRLPKGAKPRKVRIRLIVEEI